MHVDGVTDVRAVYLNAQLTPGVFAMYKSFTQRLPISMIGIYFLPSRVIYRGLCGTDWKGMDERAFHLHLLA